MHKHKLSLQLKFNVTCIPSTLRTTAQYIPLKTGLNDHRVTENRTGINPRNSRTDRERGFELDVRGEVSGATRAMPCAAAARWAPDLMTKFSSLQVSPERKYSTCARPRQRRQIPEGRGGWCQVERALTGRLEAGDAGTKREKVMGHPSAALWWRKRRMWPPNILLLLSCSGAAAGGGGAAAAIAGAEGVERGRWVERAERA